MVMARKVDTGKTRGKWQPLTVVVCTDKEYGDAVGVHGDYGGSVIANE